MAMTNKTLAVQTAISTAVNAITSDAAAYNFDLNGGLKFGAPAVDEVVSGRPEVFLQSLEEENIMRTGGKRLHGKTYSFPGSKGRDHAQDVTRDDEKSDVVRGW